MDDVLLYAVDHGFVIENALGMLEAKASQLWPDDVEPLSRSAVALDGFDALAQAENDGGTATA